MIIKDKTKLQELVGINKNTGLQVQKTLYQEKIKLDHEERADHFRGENNTSEEEKQMQLKRTQVDAQFTRFSDNWNVFDSLLQFWSWFSN